MAGALALRALGLRAHTFLPGCESRLAVGELELALGQPVLGTRLTRRDGVDSLLETRLHALDLELGRAQVALARAERLLARAQRVFLRDRLRTALIEVGALALQLALALGDEAELPRELRCGLRAVVVRRLEVRMPGVHLDAELGEPRLIGDELGPVQVDLAPLGRDLLELLLERAFPPLELGLARGGAGGGLLDLGLAQGEVAAGLELVLAHLDLVLQRLAKLLLAAERVLELRAQAGELGDRRLHDHVRLVVERALGRLADAGVVRRLIRLDLDLEAELQLAVGLRLCLTLLPLQLRAEAGPEAVFDVGAHCLK
jgi:hypothetical protein